MIKIILLFVFLLWTKFDPCLAANEGNCKIHFPNNETINWNVGYDNHQTLKDTDDVELILPFENKLEVRSVENPFPHIAEYFSVNTLGTNLVIKTTDKFKDFEKDYGCYNDTKGQIARFIITVTMICESEKPSSLDFIFRFIDTNNHDPTFPKASYEYKVASPLVPDLDYTLLGQEIIAEDVDFSNTDITFTIENNDYFSLSSKKVENCFPRKQAVIKAKTFTYLKSETTELILTATDSGTPPRKSTTKLIFIRNKDAVLPEVPKFQKPLYSATYSVNGNDHSLKLDELITATPKEAVVSLSKTSNDAALLKNFTPIKSGNSWDLKLNAHLDDAILKRGDTLSIVLEATIDNDDKGISYTTITIKLPHVEAVETPKFAKSFYNAQYSDSLPTTVSLTDGPINVIFPSPTQLEFSQDESNPQYFKFDYTANPQISVATKLPNGILKANKDVFIKLNVKSKGSSAIASSTVIAVHLPPVKTLKFDKDVYTFDYKTDQSTHYLKGPSNLKLLVKDTQTKIDFVQTQATTSNFVIDQTTYEISVKTNLDKVVLDNVIELVLSVKATSDLSLDGFATIIINLPKKATVIPTPKFAKSFYNAQYNDNLPTPTVSLTDGPISVTFSAQDYQLEFSQNDSNPQYFKFDYTANPQISVATKLPNGILKANKDVFIKLNVKFKGSSAIASSTVIAVHLPPVKTLKFDRQVYTFDYKTDQSSHYLTGPADLKLLVKDAQTSLDFLRPINNFVIDQTTYKISVKPNLDKGILDYEMDLVLSVKATSDMSVDGFATIIINLPKKTKCIGTK